VGEEGRPAAEGETVVVPGRRVEGIVPVGTVQAEETPVGNREGQEVVVGEEPHNGAEGHPKTTVAGEPHGVGAGQRPRRPNQCVVLVPLRRDLQEGDVVRGAGERCVDGRAVAVGGMLPAA
jgi:hypothetical protein